jgi:hypothetical protein
MSLSKRSLYSPFRTARTVGGQMRVIDRGMPEHVGVHWTFRITNETRLCHCFDHRGP